MSEWNTTSVGEIAEIFDGPHATPTKIDSGPWFLSISSLDHGRLNLAESAHLAEDDFAKWTRRVTPRAGDLLFSYETRLGDAALMPDGIRACLGRRMGILRPRRDRVDPRFLLYTYLGPGFQQVIQERSIRGATVDRIPLTELGMWPISIPSMGEQQAIAELLGALDDKIALNDRIAVAYEEILRLRFDALRIDVEPDTNQAATASDLITFNPGLRPPAVTDAVYVDMAALPVTAARVQNWSRRSPKSGTRFMNGDTVMARITPCLENGKTAYIDFLEDNEVGVGSTEFIVMRANPGYPSHLSYFLARSLRFREHAIRNMVGSSGRQRVAASSLFNFPLRKPEDEDLAGFQVAAGTAFDHMRSLDSESKTLAELRDTLLPKLMSGEIRVRDAEKVVEDAV